METSKLINAFTDLHTGKKVQSFGGAKNQIRHNTTWGRLERVWNDGRGIISFAVVDPKDNVLLINKLFCSPSEIKDINTNLKVPFQFVNLGYPDYYSKGLIEVRE